MTFRLSSPLASSRTSPLVPRSSAKPSFYRRVGPGRALGVVGASRAVKRPEPSTHSRPGPGGVVVVGQVGSGTGVGERQRQPCPSG